MLKTKYPYLIFRILCRSFFCGTIRSFILVFSLFISISLFAAKPVTVIVSLRPPYTPFLNEYGSLGADQLQVSIIVNDSRMINYPAKLQMLIERVGSGVVMRTGDYASIAPIMLTGNVTEFFNGFDLSEHFLYENLVFVGMDGSQYLRTGHIPNDRYRIGFRVVDSRRPEVVLSNTSYSQPGWFLLNNPPQINIPINQSVVRVNEVQNVKFNWFPRHLGSLNKSFSSLFQLEVFAIRVPGMNPNQLASSMSPNFTDVTSLTSYFLTSDKYVLEPGVEYAFRVKAMSGSGDELTLFQNQGYSDVYSFTYGTVCHAPENNIAEPLDRDKVLIKWDNAPSHTSFEVRFRRAGHSEDKWHQRESVTENVEIGNILSSGVSYEYQIKGICLNVASDYSPLSTFTLPEPVETDFDCGAEDSVIAVTNRVPKQSLRAGDKVHYGKFPIKLTEVSGSNGIFTGKGRMRVPFLAYASVNMQFNGIKVNELNEVYEGEVVSIYNPDSKFLIKHEVSDRVENKVSGEEEAIAGVVPSEDDKDDSDNDSDTSNDPPSDGDSDDTLNVAENNDSNNTDSNSSDSNNSDGDDSSNKDNGNSSTSVSSNTGTNTSSSSNGSTNNPTTDDTKVVIVHENKNYKDGDIIEVPYDANQSYFAFLLKDYPEDAIFDWQVLTLGTDNTSAYATSETIHDNLDIDMKQIHVLDIVANYNDKKIQVTIKRKSQEFKLEELYALHDINRSAKSGEILYLVNPPSISNTTKIVKYNLKIEPKLKENALSPKAIQWSFNGENQNFSTAKTDITRELEESDNIITTSVNAGNPNSLEKSVDVQWVDEDEKSFNVVPTAIQFTIEEIFKSINKVKKFSENYGKHGIEISPEISFFGSQINEEDKKSRFYNIIRDGGVDASVSIVYDFPLPPPYSINLTIPIVDYKVGEIGAYIKLNAGLMISGGLRYEKRNDGNSFVITENTIELGVNGGSEFGAIVEVLPEVESVVFNIKAFGKASLTAKGQLIFNADGTYKFEPAVFINPLIGGFNGEIKVGAVTIFNQNFEWTLLERKQIYP